MVLTREDILGKIANFTWSFGTEFFLETDAGNFVWNDPDYCGDNSIKPFDGSYKDWCRELKIPYGRDKGTKVIREYCGESITYIGGE